MMMEDVAALYGDGGYSCSLWLWRMYLLFMVMVDVAALYGDGGCSCSLW